MPLIPLTKSLLHTTDTYIKKLADAGVVTVRDFLLLFPKGLEDKSDLLTRFSAVNIREKQTIKCQIELLTSEYTRNKKQLIKAVLVDSDGNYSEAVWFNRKFLLQKFAAGDTVILFGQPKYEYGKLSFPGAEIEHFREKRQEIVPIYSDVNYISGNWIREKMVHMKPYISELPEDLPEPIRQKKGFRRREENVWAIHFPKDIADFERAKIELGYREIFHFQRR